MILLAHIDVHGIPIDLAHDEEPSVPTDVCQSRGDNLALADEAFIAVDVRGGQRSTNWRRLQRADVVAFRLGGGHVCENFTRNLDLFISTPCSFIYLFLLHLDLFIYLYLQIHSRNRC